MKPESIAIGIAGVFFGLLVGWILGSRSGQPAAVPSMPARQGSAQSAAPPPPLDESRARALEAVAAKDPKNRESRVQLGNLYFDAERYDQAIKWYEEAMKLDARDPNVSTDLGVSYFYTNQPDRALAQFDHSLKIDPRHAKTMLNIGIVRAFGKEDLKGAMEVWQKLIDTAPGSPEAERAKRALESLRAAHPEIGK